MGMVAVISRTAGSTSSKRRALTREAERLAAELVEVDRRRHRLSGADSPES
jgi:hypothetical protein